MNSEAEAGAYPKNLNRQIHGLRGFSALAVFVFHIYGMGTVWGFWPARLDPAAGLFIACRHGVEIFFVISGYLITASLVRHRSAKNFLIDRCIRIYPVFLTIQSLVFVFGPIIRYRWLAGITPGRAAETFVSNALFLPGVFDLPLAQLNAWSLSYEAGFYLLSVGVFVATRLAGRRLATIGLALLIVPILSLYPRASFFLIGVTIFFLVSRGLSRTPRLLQMVSLPALAITLALLALSEESPDLTFVALLPAFAFFWSIVEGKCPLSAALRWRGLQYLGTISYSFYLWSPVVTYPMKLAIQRFLLGRIDNLAITVLFALFGFALSAPVAHLSYRYLEGGAGKLLHRWGQNPI
jgi:peptidoglycan/LPS O-acetylase OafA/YrhL